MVIGKYAKPRPLKDIRKMPVIYKSQKCAWMSAKIFEEWYFDVFIPEVKNYQEATGHFGRVIIILDNAPSHPKLSKFNTDDENFKIIYFSSNIIFIIQPMDQLVINSFKMLYKKMYYCQSLLMK